MLHLLAVPFVKCRFLLLHFFQLRIFHCFLFTNCCFSIGGYFYIICCLCSCLISQNVLLFHLSLDGPDERFSFFPTPAVGWLVVFEIVMAGKKVNIFMYLAEILSAIQTLVYCSATKLQLKLQPYPFDRIR